MNQEAQEAPVLPPRPMPSDHMAQAGEKLQWVTNSQLSDRCYICTEEGRMTLEGRTDCICNKWLSDAYPRLVYRRDHRKVTNFRKRKSSEHQSLSSDEDEDDDNSLKNPSSSIPFRGNFDKKTIQKQADKK